MVEFEADVLLLDLDGTLVDSSQAITRMWRAWAGRNGIDPAEIFAVSEGRQAWAVIAELAPHLDPHAEDEALIREQIEDTEGTVALPGAAAFLDGLGADQWAIVTSCTRELAEVRLRVAGLPRPAILISADDVERSKPHPDGFTLGAERCGVSPDRCLAFEDSGAGLEAARRAGMRRVAITGAARHRHEADAAAADWRGVRVEGAGAMRVAVG